MTSSSFQNHLRFAFQKETLESRQGILRNRCERIGDMVAWFAYDFRHFFVKIFFDPRTITIELTLLAMLLTSLIFYPFITGSILCTIFFWLIDTISWNDVRFILWVICEITIVGLGLRIFGRFSNHELKQTLLS
jgi:hypothetical protein